jgi:hypothetical protein
MGRPTKLLDPAAGRGEFLRWAPAAERWLVDAVAYEGVEVGPGIKVLVGDIMTLELPTAYFDGIFVSNFLEHLDSPVAIAAFLAKMRTHMALGGTIAVMGPNFKYCGREYFDCADHIVALSHVSVGEQLYAAGFEIVEIVPRFLPYSFRSILPASGGLTRGYLKCRPAWTLLGKQFLATARRV